MTSARIPKRNATGSAGIGVDFGCVWSVDLGDEGWVVPFQKIEYSVLRCDEGTGELRVGRMADYHQQGDAVLDNGCKFVGFVANAAIVGDGYPAALAYLLQPDRVGTIVRKMIRVPLYL